MNLLKIQIVSLIVLFMNLISAQSKADTLVQEQSFPSDRYGISYDSAFGSQYIYVLHQELVLPLQNPGEDLRGYRYNPSTQLYDQVNPFGAGGAGSSFVDPYLISIGLAQPASTLLHHFYFMSKNLFGDRIGWSSIQSNGTILPSAGILTQGTGGVTGLSSVQDMAITPSLSQSFIYTASKGDDVVGIFSRDMTTGALTYVGNVGPALSPSLVDPSSLSVSPSGTRLGVVSVNRVSIFNILTNGTLTLFANVTNSCVTGAKDIVLTNNSNEFFVSANGVIRKVSKNPVTLLWGCSAFEPAFWTGKEVRLARGRGESQLIASVSGSEIDFDFNSIVLLAWPSTGLQVLSELYSTPSSYLYDKPARAVITKDGERAVVGNLGLNLFAGPFGFNILRYDDRIFKNGFEN